MTEMIYVPLLFVASACWRRLYGGGFGKLGDMSRFWKYLMLIGIVLSMYFFKGILDWQNWRMYAVIVCFMIYWAIGHGAWFCYWDASDSAEGRKPIIDKILWALVGVDKSRTFWGNALGMCIRYTLTSIGVALFIPNCWFMLAGVIVALCYVPAGFKQDTRIGELLAGGCVFTFLWWCL